MGLHNYFHNYNCGACSFYISQALPAAVASVAAAGGSRRRSPRRPGARRARGARAPVPRRARLSAGPVPMPAGRGVLPVGGDARKIGGLLVFVALAEIHEHENVIFFVVHFPNFCIEALEH